jgi:hypothetical protein
MTTNKRESRHSPNLTILIAVIFLVVSNHFHCRITDPEPVDEKKFVSVTGTIYEVTEEGIHPSADAVVKLYLIGDSMNTVTDGEGNFKFDIADTIEHITIRVTKPERTEVDTVLTLTGEIHLELTIVQLLNYFPIKVNTSWTYEIRRMYGGPFGRYTLIEGIERWTIIGYSEVFRTGMLRADFEGISYKLDDVENTADTTEVSGWQTFGFKIENNNLIVTPSGDATDHETMLGRFLGFTGYELFQVCYPVNSPDVVEYRIGYNQPRTIILERGVGFLELYGATWTVFDTSLRLVLTEFKIPED